MRTRCTPNRPADRTPITFAVESPRGWVYVVGDASHRSPARTERSSDSIGGTMRGFRVSLVVCMGVIACTKTENRERPAADRSPYGELEIARAHEVPAMWIPLPSGPTAQAGPPTPHDTRRPSKPPSRPAQRHASADSTTSAVPPAAVPTSPPADTSGYAVYPVEPAAADTDEPRPSASVPEPAPPGDRAASVPAGTVIHAALEDSIDSRLDIAGRTVAAKVCRI